MPSLGVELIIKHTKFKLIRKVYPLLMEENYQAQTKRQQQYYLGKLHSFIGLKKRKRMQAVDGLLGKEITLRLIYTMNKNSDDIRTKETFHTNKRKITGAQEGWQPFPLNM